MKKLTPLCASLVPFMITCAAVFTGSAHASDLGSALEKIRSAHRLPALGALRLEGSTVTEAAVVGVRRIERPTPATVADDWHLGSDTKAMTATLVALFVERGKLRWEETLGEMFPELRAMSPAYRAVRLDQMLAHRAGLPANVGSALMHEIQRPNIDTGFARARIARRILTMRPFRKPGSEFLYSNLGYVLAGLILERVSQRSWEDLMRDELFVPLGMGSCGFGPAGDPRASEVPNQPWAHAPGASGALVSFAPIRANDNPPAYGPAGTVHCSLADWAKFVSLHLEGERSRPTRILTRAGFVKLHERYPGQDYTYGGWGRVKVNGGEALTHDGSNGANYASVWILPERDQALLAVANAGDAEAGAAVQEAIVELATIKP